MLLKVGRSLGSIFSRRKGVREATENGALAGYPMVDLQVTLFDGSYHDVDSSEIAFKIAGSMALKAAARKANPVLLEPIMAVEVVVPETLWVMSLVTSTRGEARFWEWTWPALRPSMRAFL